MYIHSYNHVFRAFTEARLHIYTAVGSVGGTFRGCRAEIRTRVCLIASQRTTVWAMLHPIKNWKKLTAKKKLFFLHQKTTIYLSLSLQKGRPSYRRSPPKENIQHFKTWNFLIFFYCCGSYLPSWTRIRIQIHWSDWIRTQYGSETLLIFSSNNSVGFTLRTQSRYPATYAIPYAITLHKADEFSLGFFLTGLAHISTFHCCAGKF